MWIVIIEEYKKVWSPRNSILVKFKSLVRSHPRRMLKDRSHPLSTLFFLITYPISTLISRFLGHPMWPTFPNSKTNIWRPILTQSSGYQTGKAHSRPLPIGNWVLPRFNTGHCPLGTVEFYPSFPWSNPLLYWALVGLFGNPKFFYKNRSFLEFVEKNIHVKKQFDRGIIWSCVCCLNDCICAGNKGRLKVQIKFGFSISL